MLHRRTDGVFPEMGAAARDDIERLVEEQAALRRVATLVAGVPDPRSVFEMVTLEASRLLDLPVLTLVRFEPDGTATVMAAVSDRPFSDRLQPGARRTERDRHDPRDGPAGAGRLV